MLFAIVYSLIMLFILPPISAKYLKAYSDIREAMPSFAEYFLTAKYAWIVYVLGGACVAKQFMVENHFANAGINIMYIVFLLVLSICWAYSLFCPISTIDLYSPPK
jgi:hypothetical protein